MKELKGVYAVTITPFTKDNKVDYEGLKSNVNWYIESGLHGVLPAGSTGEYVSLSDEERFNVAKTTMEAAKGKISVIVGATAETAEKTIEFAQHAEKIGADGVMVLPPYYCKPLPSEIYAHYKRVGEAINIPIILYNNPWTSGIDICLKDVIKILEDVPNAQIVKESSGQIQRTRDLLMQGPEKTKVFCGWEDLAFEAFVLGATGWISPVADIAPKIAVALFNAVVDEKDFEKGREIYNKILPLCQFLENSGKLVQAVKFCLDRIGKVGGHLRSPRLPLTSEEEEKLEVILKDLELL
jgi:4-hydroxy-tetrahydrodipicolinate synthase